MRPTNPPEERDSTAAMVAAYQETGRRIAQSAESIRRSQEVTKAAAEALEQSALLLAGVVKADRKRKLLFGD